MYAFVIGLPYTQSLIFLQDINDRNILTNGYCPGVDVMDARSIACEHSCTPSASFCLMDFDLAIQLPRDVSLKGCRRPLQEAFRGSPQYHPSDCSLAQPEYNLFAFDVGCLGMVFICHFVVRTSARSVTYS